MPFLAVKPTTLFADDRLFAINDAERHVYVYSHDISRITKLDTDYVPPRRLETRLFWDQKVKGEGHDRGTNNSAGVSHGALVGAGFFQLMRS